jgi:hypothetical protein
MRGNFVGLFALAWLSVAGTVLPAAAAEPPPGTESGWLELPDVTGLLRRGVERFRRLESVEMASAILGGSHMGPGEGWFHPGRSRYGWAWLAERFDANKDGRITREEFRGPADLFQRLDRNRDGVLTADDFDWSDRSAFLRQAGPFTAWFYQMDADSNGRVSREEWEAFFNKASKGKGYLTADDLREALQPPPARPRSAGPPPGMPSPATLLKGMIAGEVGSLFEGPGVGDRAPNFTLKTQDGTQQISLRQYRGHKPVVLIFGSFT